MFIQRRAALRLGLVAGAAGVVGSTAGLAAAEGAEPSSGAGALSDEALVRSLRGDFRNGYARVNGIRMHYVIGGRGAPLVLLPGWPQTWWQYHKVLPALAAHYRVIAVDLRGMGGSDKPAGGYDKKTMAKDIHELIRHLGYDRVDIAGHDIGAMVAFSFAANHPAATRKLAVLDVPHPDEELYGLTLLPRPGDPFFLWWFAFNQVRGLPEQLLTGRSRYLVDHLCTLLLRDQAKVDERDRAVYARAYSYPDAIRAGNGWYQAFGQDIVDVATYPRVTMPVLAMASEGNTFLRDQVAARATDVTGVEIAGSGHLLAEEQPEAVVQGLVKFFG